ncbi:Rho GTPase-activating protein 3 [Heracleum sosnowskyi]|uniref:Rho GTPase-activating protein 3 n=1 Tax=Heracleum sosnowskyi TaxID=360622 RepID=A0AAD8HP77_9APIA|nr:Rho GTPase-activating protein 3 [Heracleum sosnowskyi]
MTRLFRSKSNHDLECTSKSPTPSRYLTNEEEDDDEDEEDDYFLDNPITTPFIGPNYSHGNEQEQRSPNNNQIPQILSSVASALRKSLLVTCSVVETTQDDFSSSSSSSMEIGCPTDARHVSHVTFDRFNGCFLGLPLELQPQLPRKVPSASVSVFGVSANSMQCSYDQWGNSVPTILLAMQKRLYSGGGLQAEGIFRINAENTEEESVRNHLNRGVVPRGIDVHCLAGLIKAWFRELPTGVLDSLTAEQVMHCNTEDECTQLIAGLPPTEASLLNWAINLMADVVMYENLNKMNARNIAMVFAPNMTQMADPLTALIHAVQVMNFLKTLIMKALRERGDFDAIVGLFSSCGDSPTTKVESRISSSNRSAIDSVHKETGNANILQSSTIGKLESDREEKLWSFNCKDGREFDYESPISASETPVTCRKVTSCQDGDDNRETEGILSRLSFTKGVRRLYRHPLFQLNKVVKKSGTLGIVDARGECGKVWT